MDQLQEKTIQCPYCWETITVMVDNSEADQDYIEDCQVCCRPIRFIVQINEAGDTDIQVLHENE